MDNKVYEKAGSLTLFYKCGKENIDLLMSLLCRGNNEYIQLLRDVVKDDVALLELFDVMSGQRVQFPERKKIYKTLEKVIIYNYCRSQNFSEASYIAMTKQYNKRLPQTKSIVSTIQKFLDSNTNEEFEEYMEKDDINE